MDFGNLRNYLPISRSKIRRFPSGKVKVDGVEIAGTDRNFDLPKRLGGLLWYSMIRSYPSDMVCTVHKHLMAFFVFERHKREKHVTNKVTFLLYFKKRHCA